MDFAYNPKSKFLDTHIAENIKWNVCEKSWSSVQIKVRYIITCLMEIMSSHVIRSTIFNNLMLISCIVQFLGYGTGCKLMYKLENEVMWTIIAVWKQMSCMQISGPVTHCQQPVHIRSWNNML
jgi:hypothetical protein